MALTPEEKTQKQVDAAVKAALKRERSTIKVQLDTHLAHLKAEGDKAGVATLKNFASALKSTQAASNAPLGG